MKTFMILSGDGEEKNSAGEEAHNTQVLGVETAEDVLTAYNQFLDEGINLNYDSCYLQELVSEAVMGRFDLITDTDNESGLIGENFEPQGLS